MNRKLRGFLIRNGVYAAFSFVLVFVFLFVANSFFLADANSSPIAIFGDKTVLATPPDDATCLSFSFDKKYYSYIKDGKVYVKKTGTNSVVKTIEEKSPIQHSFMLDDRNIIIYFTHNSPAKKTSSIGIANPISIVNQSATPKAATATATPKAAKNSNSDVIEISPYDAEDTPLKTEKPQSTQNSQSTQTPKPSSTPTKKPPSSSNIDNSDIGPTVSNNGSDKLEILAYNIDQNKVTPHQAFTIKNFAKIKQVQYSSLTNLIYLNAETKAGSTVGNNVYRIDIMKNVSLYSSSKIIKAMTLLDNEDTIYFQDNSNKIYKNNKAISLLTEDKNIANLLGRDDDDNVYLQSIKNMDKIYKITENKLAETKTLQNPYFNSSCVHKNGLYLVYADKVINFSKAPSKDIAFKPNTTFSGISGKNLYVKNQNGEVLSINLE